MRARPGPNRGGKQLAGELLSLTYFRSPLSSANPLESTKRQRVKWNNNSFGENGHGKTRILKDPAVSGCQYNILKISENADGATQTQKKSSGLL
ncbi:hypothetical protein DsansV1_C38g0235501 [Dioscorea sansibarensis]